MTKFCYLSILGKTASYLNLLAFQVRIFKLYPKKFQLCSVAECILISSRAGFLISIIFPRLSADPTVRAQMGLPPYLTAAQSRILFIPSIIFVAAVILGWLLVLYNSLVNLRNVVDHAFSMIDIQLKRRSDLIPNLVEIIEGYKEHEEEIQVQTAMLRSQTKGQEKPIPVISLIQSMAEAYPELKAGQQFLELQRTLEETEQRIALARDYYNQQTQFYNTRLEVMPDMFLARLGGLKPKKYWEAENFQRAKEKIDFAS